MPEAVQIGLTQTIIFIDLKMAKREYFSPEIFTMQNFGASLRKS